MSRDSLHNTVSCLHLVADNVVEDIPLTHMEATEIDTYTVRSVFPIPVSWYVFASTSRWTDASTLPLAHKLFTALDNAPLTIDTPPFRVKDWATYLSLLDVNDFETRYHYSDWLPEYLKKIPYDIIRDRTTAHPALRCLIERALDIRLPVSDEPRCKYTYHWGAHRGWQCALPANGHYCSKHTPQPPDYLRSAN